MKQKGVIIGAISIFAGLVLIPFAYPFSTFLAAMAPVVLIGEGLLLIGVTNMLRNPNVKPDTVPDKKRIVIDINDNGISLTTGGMSPQEIICFLELSKYYVITKSIRTGSLIDVVKRE